MLYFEEAVFTFVAKRRYTFVEYSGVSGKVIMLNSQYAAPAEKARSAMSTKPALQFTVGLRLCAAVPGRERYVGLACW